MLRVLKSKIVAVVATLMLSAVPLAAPAMASAAGSELQNCVAQGTTLNGGDVFGSGQDVKCKGDTKGGTVKINGLIKTVVDIMSVLVGVISVIMIIYGGFRYITSGGDSGNVTSAKNTIIYAVIGLIIVALAQFIVQFVLNKVTDAS